MRDFHVSEKLAQEVETRITRFQGQRDGLLEARHKAEVERIKAAQLRGWHEQALAVLQQVEQNQRGVFEEALAGVVSYGLSVIFESPLRIKVISDVKRGVTSLKLTITDGEVETDILDFEGGSTIHVLTMLLRVLLVVSARPVMRRLLILDEPFSWVSAEYRPALCALLKELSARLDIQFLIVSHEEELLDAADMAYLVEKKDGEAHFSRLKTPEEVQ